MTMYPYLKDNITALEKANPALYRWLSGSTFDEQSLKTNVFVNKWGIIDWRLESGQGLFEAMPPGALYRDWVTLEKPELSASIVVGSNLGYGLNHLLINTPDSHKILVLEPNAPMQSPRLRPLRRTPLGLLRLQRLLKGAASYFDSQSLASPATPRE